jgi:hypothetical protein
MGDRIDERRHADHPPHLDKCRPAQDRRRGGHRQGHKQDHGGPHARPIGEGGERKRPGGSVISGVNEISGTDCRCQHQRERGCLEPGKPTSPVLPWPDQLHGVSPSSQTCHQTQIKGGYHVPSLRCMGALHTSQGRGMFITRSTPPRSRCHSGAGCKAGIRS